MTISPTCFPNVDLGFIRYTLVALVVLCSRVYAAIPGVPETRPGQDPVVAIAWSNDWFGFPSSLSAKEDDPNDDHRTNSFTVIGRQDQIRLALDHSMLTSKPHGLRTDELSATAGHDFGMIVVGGGMRLRGNFGGAPLQNWFHRVSHDVRVELEQEKPSKDFIAYALAELPGLPVDRWWSLTPVASCLVSSNLECAEDLGLRLVYNGEGVSSWFGCRYQWRDGGDSRLIDDVQQYERGLKLDYGIAWHDGFSFSVLYSPEHSAGVGTLAWSF